ncbi:FAD-dependent monooxygenase [Ornithinimicrobium sp. Y1847]|uniref:FAD-dependent monooxygenase n=1 Tax=Ornithinimicrobium sp. Y1847 TaxID=3405419 RepID=UPI003B6824E9
MVTRRIAIVGGGIGGLTLAAALAQASGRGDGAGRFEVVVHEAQPERASLGSPLGLWPDALRALERIGARGAVEAAGFRPGGGALRDLPGRARVSAGGVDLLMVPRPALLAALTSALTYAVRDAMPGGVRMLHEEVLAPDRLDADLVIGADGVRSRVRGLVHPAAAQRRETPYVALRGSCGTVPEEAVGEYWGPGVLFGLVPVGQERGYWFTSHRSDLRPEPLDVAAVLAQARERFRGAAPIIGQVLRDAGVGTATTATRIWVTPPMPRYVRGRYAVIGDAAHAMTPNLGRGACAAIVDAVTLADAIRAGRPRAWQMRRLPITQTERVASSVLMRVALRERWGGAGQRPRAGG